MSYGLFGKHQLVYFVLSDKKVPQNIKINNALYQGLTANIEFTESSPYKLNKTKKSNETEISLINDINKREFLMLFPLFIITLIFGIYPDIILSSIHMSITKVIYLPI